MVLKFKEAKEIRAKVILKHYKRIVVFTCGNASKALRKVNKDAYIVSIGDKNDNFQTERWYTQKEIATMFPDYFDATSGHLPFWLMEEIAIEFKKHLGDLTNAVDVPTGSGETLVCLKMAYPHVKFNAIYNLNEHTKYNVNAPLNNLVKLLANKIIT